MGAMASDMIVAPGPCRPSTWGKIVRRYPPTPSFLNPLISNVLGLRRFYDDVVFDPVLPRRADGLTLDLVVAGRPIRYLFHVTGDGFSPGEVRVNGRLLPGGRYAPNPNRRGGLLVASAAFDAALDRATNLVEIFV